MKLDFVVTVSDQETGHRWYLRPDASLSDSINEAKRFGTLEDASQVANRCNVLTAGHGVNAIAVVTIAI